MTKNRVINRSFKRQSLASPSSPNDFSRRLRWAPSQPEEPDARLERVHRRRRHQHARRREPDPRRAPADVPERIPEDNHDDAHHHLHDLHGHAEAQEIFKHVPAGAVHHQVRLIPKRRHERRGRREHHEERHGREGLPLALRSLRGDREHQRGGGVVRHHVANHESRQVHRDE